jgi:hypothetical protein
MSRYRQEYVCIERLQLNFDPVILSNGSGVAYSFIRSLIFKKEEYFHSELVSCVVNYCPVLSKHKLESELSLFICLSPCLSLNIYISVCPSACLSLSLSICLCISLSLSIYMSLYFSMALQPFVGPWPLFQSLDLFTQSIGRLGG